MMKCCSSTPDHHIDTNNDDKVDKTVALNKQFGSKKIKRKTEQFEKMKVNVDNVKDQLENLVSNIEIHRDELEDIEKCGFLNDLLPINRNATDKSEIYNINDIVPSNILKALCNPVDEAVKKIEKKPIFFVQTVKHCKNDEQYIAKLSMLLYIEAIILWLNNPIKLGKKSDIVVCPYSSEVNNYVIETYSIPSNHGRQRPNSMRDKGIIHCIILGLMI